MNFKKGLMGLVVSCSTVLTPNEIDSCEIYTTPAFGNTPAQTIIKPCSPTLTNPHYKQDAKPSLFEKALGRWNADVIYHPGNRQMDCFGREIITTPQIIHKPEGDFIQLNPNGTVCERSNGVHYTGFFGVDFNPKQNTEGQINFYRSLNPRVLIRSAKIEVNDDNAMRFSYPTKWNHVFSK